MIFHAVFNARVYRHICVVLVKRGVDAAVDEVAPEEGEDDGAGEQEVEEGDLDPSNLDRKAGTEGNRRSENNLISLDI